MKRPFRDFLSIWALADTAVYAYSHGHPQYLLVDPGPRRRPPSFFRSYCRKRLGMGVHAFIAYLIMSESTSLCFLSRSAMNVCLHNLGHVQVRLLYEVRRRSESRVGTRPCLWDLSALVVLLKYVYAVALLSVRILLTNFRSLLK